MSTKAKSVFASAMMVQEWVDSRQYPCMGNLAREISYRGFSFLKKLSTEQLLDCFYITYRIKIQNKMSCFCIFKKRWVVIFFIIFLVSFIVGYVTMFFDIKNGLL